MWWWIGIRKGIGTRKSFRVPIPTTRSQPHELFLIFRMWSTSDDALPVVASGDHARSRRLAFRRVITLN
eukprot:3430738-Pleurochrysis_carterae.AAC.3